jgi:GNAT superfamily N-acetyltransferase
MVCNYFRPDETPWVTAWTHPRTGAQYTIGLVQSGRLSEDELMACFHLIELTSREDYDNSAGKWHPDKKLKEMKSPELRYILVKEKDTGAIHGFTSLMPTYEEGQPVIYCYEIHLQPGLQGYCIQTEPDSALQAAELTHRRTGLGSLLMSFHSTVAANLPPISKVMLTCFLSNQRGLDFYRKLGFEKDEISPGPRKLRYGKTFTPDYVIMSKPVRSSFTSSLPSVE